MGIGYVPKTRTTDRAELQTKAITLMWVATCSIAEVHLAKRNDTQIGRVKEPLNYICI